MQTQTKKFDDSENFYGVINRCLQTIYGRVCCITIFHTFVVGIYILNIGSLCPTGVTLSHSDYMQTDTEH